MTLSSYDGIFGEAELMLAELGKSLGSPGGPPEFESFSISTRIPLPLLVSEEKALDYERLEGKTCLKKRLNAFIAERLARLTGKPYSLEGGVRFVFNFMRRKVSWECAPLYVFGRYRKLSREIAQSKWHCTRCLGRGCEHCEFKGKMYDSVEEIVAGHFSEFGKETKFHSSGREDIDARMLGNGRPFLLEFPKPLKPLTPQQLDAIGKKINEDCKFVAQVRGLRLADRRIAELVDQSHFTKEYEVFVECENPVSKARVRELNAIVNLMVSQQTPERVLHRRADLVRERVLRKLECTQAKPRLLRLRLACDAGFYVKEFVHGDNGRTKPSLSSMLGMKCAPRELDVVNIQDAYLDFMMSTFGVPMPKIKHRL